MIFLDGYFSRRKGVSIKVWKETERFIKVTTGSGHELRPISSLDDPLLNLKIIFYYIKIPFFTSLPSLS